MQKAATRVEVPADVLRRSPNILPEYQGDVWRQLSTGVDGALIADDADLEDVATFHAALGRLSALYNWRTTESLGA